MARPLLLVALLPLSHALVAPPTRHARIHALRAVVDYEVEEGGEARATPLSRAASGSSVAIVELLSPVSWLTS